jgi:hypothetical protein
LETRDTADLEVRATFSAFSASLRFPVNSTKKRIALAAARRIIASNLPVVGEAVCWTKTQMRNTLTNMKLDSYNDE